VHRIANSVDGGVRGMGESPLLFRGRDGMHSIVHAMLHNAFLSGMFTSGCHALLAADSFTSC
jgi:hypothetical protein